MVVLEKGKGDKKRKWVMKMEFMFMVFEFMIWFSGIFSERSERCQH